MASYSIGFVNERDDSELSELVILATLNNNKNLIPESRFKSSVQETVSTLQEELPDEKIMALERQDVEDEVWLEDQE